LDFTGSDAGALHPVSTTIAKATAPNRIAFIPIPWSASRADEAETPFIRFCEAAQYSGRESPTSHAALYDRQDPCASHVRQRRKLVMGIAAASCRSMRTGQGALLLAAVSCTAPPAVAVAVAVPPIPAGEARVWFYRDAGPYEAQERPYIRMNEQIAGISEPRGTFYRDVPPGHYHVTVDSYGRDFNQTKDVDLGPGQQVYFKIVSLKGWMSRGGGEGPGYSRPTFYVWAIPAEMAQGEVARSPFYGGS
jgi:hypothetical protein